MYYFMFTFIRIRRKYTFHLMQVSASTEQIPTVQVLHLRLTIFSKALQYFLIYYFLSLFFAFYLIYFRFL